MKIQKKILIIANFALSVMLYSQQLKPLDKQKLQMIENDSKKYVGKKFKVLLQDLPEIKMVRIAPNNPTMNVHTFIIGFVDNATFSRKITNTSISKERVTLYLKGNNQHINVNKLTKEDLTTCKAIEKYGDLVIASILQ